MIDDSSAATRRRRVGLVYNENMCKHSPPRSNKDHPENPNRIRAIWDKLVSANIPQRCVVLNGKEVDDQHIAAVHSKKLIELVKTISSKKMDSRRNKMAAKYNSVYFNEGSSEAAYLAAGSVVEVAEKVANGELDSAFAIVRPPGHHAEECVPMGFCLYNNVAIATSFLLDERNDLGINKILIVDWDVHHGNGTQKMFWKDPRVLFFSVHRYENGSFYPGGNDGSHTMIGEGPGAGYNINVPWQNARCGDADYIAVWDNILIPVTKEFNPDMILVSAGFDAAIDDPLGDCCVMPYGYSVMLKKLMEFAQGKIVLALEGGYNLDSLAKSVLACVEVLLENKPINESSGERPLESTWQVIQMVRKELSPFWPILAKKIPDTSTTKITPQMQVLSSVSDGNYIDGLDTVAEVLEEDLINPLSNLMVEKGQVTTASTMVNQVNLQGNFFENMKAAHDEASYNADNIRLGLERIKILEKEINDLKRNLAHANLQIQEFKAQGVEKDNQIKRLKTDLSACRKEKKALENAGAGTTASSIAEYKKSPEFTKVAEKYFESGVRHMARMIAAYGFGKFDLKTLVKISQEEQFGEVARAYHPIVPYTKDELKQLAKKDALEGREPWTVPPLAEENYDTILDELKLKMVNGTKMTRWKPGFEEMTLRSLAEMSLVDRYGELARTGHSVVPYSEEELKELAEKDACEGREPWQVPPLAEENFNSIRDELFPERR